MKKKVQINRGSFGVIKADLRKKIAFKEFSINNVFWNEINLMANQESKYLMQSEAVNFNDGRVSLSMPLGEGHIFEIMQSHRIAPQKLLLYCIQIAEGIEELHRQQIIHLDIKVDNIILFSDRAVLTDYGFAVFLNNDSKFVNNSVVGTIEFRGPETRKYIYSKAADVWAFGICLIYLFCENIDLDRKKGQDDRKYGLQVDHMFKLNRDKTFKDILTGVRSKIKGKFGVKLTRIIDSVLKYNYTERASIFEAKVELIKLYNELYDEKVVINHLKSEVASNIYDYVNHDRALRVQNIFDQNIESHRSICRSILNLYFLSRKAGMQVFLLSVDIFYRYLVKSGLFKYNYDYIYDKKEKIEKLKMPERERKRYALFLIYRMSYQLINMKQANKGQVNSVFKFTNKDVDWSKRELWPLVKLLNYKLHTSNTFYFCHNGLSVDQVMQFIFQPAAYFCFKPLKYPPASRLISNDFKVLVDHSSMINFLESKKVTKILDYLYDCKYS